MPRFPVQHKRKRAGTSHRAGRPNRKRRRRYRAFINSAEWKEIRALKLKAVNGICEDCPENAKHGATQVHHTNYTRFGGEELTTDLRALCDDCHKRAHKTQKQLTGMWLSMRVGAEHAMTQFGVDIRDRLLASYDH